ncbi:MAG: Asp-tRNA(Asn)/Glu-tRNA(Gln) amidotransferase subunit GatC [Desulfuromonadales bacterium]
MAIRREEVEHVAHLARLHLDGEELDQMTEQLDTILSYVAKLDELDTTGIEPTTHAFSITNAFREDRVEESLDQEAALANGPDHTKDSFVVSRII